MKKVIALLLAVVMCLGLAACNKEDKSTDMSKEEMIKAEEAIDIEELREIILSRNIIKVETAYKDKIVAIDCGVERIEREHVYFYIGKGIADGVIFDVSLPTEEIENLERYQKVSIVGHVCEVSQGYVDEFGESYDVICLTLDKGHIV